MDKNGNILPEKTAGDGANVQNLSKVVQLSTRTRVDKKLQQAIIQTEEINQSISHYRKAIIECYNVGFSTMELKKRNELIKSCEFIGSVFADFGIDPDMFARIHASEVDVLELEEKFYKTLLTFLTNPKNEDNIDNMKEYVSRLSATDIIDEEPVYSFLNNYIGRIMEYTCFLLYEGMYTVKMDFEEIADYLKKEKLENNSGNN